MSGLRPITETCKPRPDVLAGTLADNYFAAQLDHVVRNPAGYPVYGDATEFFALTHPTTGLKRLLARTFGRLRAATAGTSAAIEGAESGVIRSETSFGGGKTHSLIAVYHLAKGARPLNLSEFIDPDLLHDDYRIAAVVADTLDPENGLVTNGIRTHTLWGEIAAQLGPGAYEKLRASDESRTAPGKATWEEIVGDEPTIIVIDEIAQHLRQLTSSGNPDLRLMARAVPAFLKTLFELAAGNRNVVVIITLATRADAYGRETDELSEALSGLDQEFHEALLDTESITARSVRSVVKPAEDFEIAEILKRRLFEHIDADAARAAGDAYRAYYERIASKGDQLAGGAEAPATYGESITASYPFHPELIRVLDKRIGTIPLFQRARGALKLLAAAVAGIWAKATDAEVINVADIDYEVAEVLSHLTVGIGRSDFEGVAQVDFASPSSHAAVIDQSRFAGRTPYATRACRTAFTHSLELVATAGAGRADYLLGTLRIGDEPALVGEALGAVEQVAWHLFYDGTRWRFLTEPNANKIVAEETKNVAASLVNEEVEDRIRRAFPTDGSIKAIHFPDGPGNVADEPNLRLVVLHHDDVAVNDRTSLPPPSKLVDLLERAGIAGGIRTFRNSVIFLTADENLRDALRERVRAEIAAQRIVSEPGRLDVYTETVQKHLIGLADTSRLEARIAVARCFKHLYLPSADRANHFLGHVELAARAQGDVEKAQTKVIHQVLVDEGKVRTQKISTDYLRSRAWPRDADEVTVSVVADAFWRDHGAPIVLDPTLFKDAVREGIKNKSWVYYDAGAQKAWTDQDPPAPVQISPEGVLLTVAEAERRGVLKQALAWEHVASALTVPQLSGPDLRRALEHDLGRDIAKHEIAEVLSRAAQAGESAKAVVIAAVMVEPGARACTPSEILKVSLDQVTVLSSAEAQRLSVQRSDRPTKKNVEAAGVAGVAFQALQDKAREVDSPGITNLVVTTHIELGAGINGLERMGNAIGQLPRFEIEVTLQLDLDFAGLAGGVEIKKLAGPGKDYQRVEDALLKLARVASQLAGSVQLSFRFADPLPPTAPQYEQIRRVLVALDPGSLKLRAVLA